MSTIKASNLQNGSSSSVNIALNTDGSATFAQMPVPSSSFLRNKLINGAMMIDQRNGGAAITPTAAAYSVDRWALQLSQASKFTIQQNAGGVTPPAGFTNYLGFTVASAVSVGASDFFNPYQNIEGLNLPDLAWGTASAAPVTLSFWVRSSLTGTFSGAVSNSASNRSYVFSYTITVANTWEYKTVTIPGETSGTWLTTNGVGVRLLFNLGTGTTYTSTAGSWQTGNFVGQTGSVSVVGTAGATWYVTGVQFEIGSVATPFERRLYPQELAMCQRYYEVGTQPMLYIGFGATGIGAAYGEARFAVTKRASTTVSTLGWQYYSGGGGVSFSPSTVGTTDRFYWANAGFTNWNGWTGSGTWAAGAEL